MCAWVLPHASRFGKTSCISPELVEPSQVQVALMWVLLCVINLPLVETISVETLSAPACRKLVGSTKQKRWSKTGQWAQYMITAHTEALFPQKLKFFRCQPRSWAERRKRRQWRIIPNVKMYMNGFIRANTVTVWEQKCKGRFLGRLQESGLFASSLSGL